MEDFWPHTHHIVPSKKRSSAEASAFDVNSTVLEFFIALQIITFWGFLDKLASANNTITTVLTVS